MDAWPLAAIWFLLPILTKPTSSLSLKPNNEHKNQEITENFNPAVPTEKTESSALTKSIGSVYTRRRFYRRADSELTSIEPTALTESITHLSTNDLIETNSSTTTEAIEVINETVIPLMTTAKYKASETVWETETDKRESVTSNILTKKYDTNDSLNVTKSYSTTEKNKLRKEDSNHIERSSNLEQMKESVILSSQSLDESGNNTTKAVTELPVLGIDSKRKEMNGVYTRKTEKYAEKIIKLPPLREEKNLVLRENVRSMAEETMLKTETENFVIQLHKKYEELPVGEADNSIWRKYARAVAETFVLDFCRNYPQYVATQSVAPLDSDKYSEYSHIYNATLQQLRVKKMQSAVQLAAPVRRAADIFKAILDTPIGIVQSKCKTNMPKWLCFAEYVVRLADISEICEHIWYHAQVHLTVLQNFRQGTGDRDPANEIIDELNTRLSEVGPNNDVNYLFDFIVNTLGDLGTRLKTSLLLQVSQFNLIRELQGEDKLKCLIIDQVLY